jgi:hypothetical protein
MVTHHDLGESSHNREEESDERRVVENPLDLAETVRILMAQLKSYKANNERLINKKEKKTEINAIPLQSLSDIQRQLQHGPTASHVDKNHTKKTPSPPEIQKHGPGSGHTGRSTSRKAQHGVKRHSPECLSEDTENSKEYSSGKTSSHSHMRGKKRKHSKSHDPEEFKKAKPPTFDGDIKKGEEAKVWLLDLKKYFIVQDYSNNLKAQIAIFNLNGKASIWWEDLRNVKGIHEKDLSRKQFEKYFKKKYLSERYFDGKTNEFYELKLGQITIDEYINKFLELDLTSNPSSICVGRLVKDLNVP